MSLQCVAAVPLASVSCHSMLGVCPPCSRGAQRLASSAALLMRRVSAQSHLDTNLGTRRACVLGKVCRAPLSACAGRSRTDGVQCWVAVSTEAFARELIAAGAGRLPAELEPGSGVTAEARSSSGALPDAESRSAGAGRPAGAPGRPAAGARLPPASPALLGAAADALWPPLRALLARAHGCTPPRGGLAVEGMTWYSGLAPSVPAESKRALLRGGLRRLLKFCSAQLCEVSLHWAPVTRTTVPRQGVHCCLLAAQVQRGRRVAAGAPGRAALGRRLQGRRPARGAFRPLACCCKR